MPSRLLIVKTGETAEPVQREHGDYDRWFTAALAKHRLELTVCDATRSAIPDPRDYQGMIVTGSVKSICRPEPWMTPLIELLGGAEHLGVPILGVCFGCQILAHACGGTVVVNPEGWEIGAVEIAPASAGVDDPLFGGAPWPLPVLATHEDRVEAPPPGAIVLAGNESTPVQAFRVGDQVWGVQFHPEGTVEILEQLIRLRSDRLEDDARRHGRPVDRHVGRLLDRLRRFDPRPQGRLLDRFVAICGGG